MGIIRVVNFMSLDGVVQSVLNAGEDTGGGFTAGGWVSDHTDDEVDPEGGPALSLRLTASRSTSSGVVLNEYQPRPAQVSRSW